MAGLFLIAGIVAAAQASGMFYTDSVAAAAVSIKTSSHVATPAANEQTIFFHTFLSFISLWSSLSGALSLYLVGAACAR